MTQPAGSDRSPRPSAGARFLPDERLAQRAAKGDERAFAAIYRRYGQDLYRFCLSIVGNPEDGRDALQNTMVKALQALPGEERSIQLRPWLYRVAHNESIELLRKRREVAQVDSDLVAPGGGPAEAAVQRERLRQLLRDLTALPERQRSMLAMRELAGLELNQIAEAFETSPAVARQTIYEARLSLRQLAEGREMSCDEVTRRLSDADGRVRRRRDIQAHLRACPDCRAFAQAIEERRHDLAALAPLPAIASAGILHAVLGGGHGAASGAAAGTTVAAGAGKVAATSALTKSVATVAVVATVGVSAADRGGLVDLGLPGGSGDAPIHRAMPEGAGSPTETTGTDGSTQASRASTQGTGQPSSTGGKPASDPNGKKPAGAAEAPTATGKADHEPPTSLPPASSHGQQTAAEHKAEPGSAAPQAHPQPPAGSQAKGSGRSQRGGSRSHGGGKPHRGSAGAGRGHPQGQSGGGTQENAPRSPSTGPAKGGSGEPAPPIGNKSSAGGSP